MTEREQFKFNFMLKAAQDGLTPDQLADRIRFCMGELEKCANMGGPNKLHDMLVALTTNVGMPLAAGAGAAWGFDSLTRPKVDVSEVRDRETIDELQTYAKRIRDQSRLRQLRQKLTQGRAADNI